MGNSVPHITAAELMIMKAIWKLGSGTVRQVLQTLPDSGGDQPAYTTVMTMMKQLGEKGALSVDRSRQPYVYTPNVHREQVLGHRVKQFLQNVFDGQAGDLVLHLAEETDLSAEDLKRLEEKIKLREKADAKKPKRRSKRAEGR